MRLRKNFSKLMEEKDVKYLGAQMLEFPQNGDEKGYLVVVEGQEDIPFDIKRIFYIYGSDSTLSLIHI